MKRLLSIPRFLLNKIKSLVSGKFKLFLVLLFIGVFGFLSLPTLSFKFNDNVINLPSFDVSPNSAIGNFRRGRDLFPTREVKTMADFGLQTISESEKIEFLNLSLKRILNRITLSGLYDIDVRAEIKDNEYSLIFTYPDYYKNIIETTTLLSRRGEITFLNGTDQQPLEIKDSDISSNIDITYNPTLQTHIKFNYPLEKSSDFQIALANQYFYMTVDGVPAFQMFQYEQNDIPTNTVRGLPVNVLTQSDLAFKDLYINVTRSYFNEVEPLQYAFTEDQNIKTIPAEFSNLTVRYIAILCMVVFIAMTVFTFIKFGMRKGIAFSLMLLSTLVFNVTFLKYISTPLSLNFLIIFFIMVAITTIYIWNYINFEDIAEVRIGSRELRNIGILLILFSFFIVKFIPNSGRFFDMLSVIFVFGFSYIIFSYFNFKSIYEQIILKFKNNE